MTAVRAGDDVVVFDMGLNLSKVLIHVDLASKHGYDLNRDLHVASNGEVLQLN